MHWCKWLEVRPWQQWLWIHNAFLWHGQKVSMKNTVLDAAYAPMMFCSGNGLTHTHCATILGTLSRFILGRLNVETFHKSTESKVNFRHMTQEFFQKGAISFGFIIIFYFFLSIDFTLFFWNQRNIWLYKHKIAQNICKQERIHLKKNYYVETLNLMRVNLCLVCQVHRNNHGTGNHSS